MVIDEHISRGDDSQLPPADASGLACDIVVSSQVRLARNIADFPFITACSDNQLGEIESTVRAGLERNQQLADLIVVEAEQLERLERRFLLQLESVTAREASADRPLETSSAPIGTDQLSVQCDELEPAMAQVESPRRSNFEGSTLTINHEDHLRLQVIRTGLDLENAWSLASQIDDLIEQQLNFAFSPQWGYLTACPANVGTGLRASVVLHLPALVITGTIDSVLRCLNRGNVCARELVGEMAGSDFFRVGNLATLGYEEEQLVRQVSQIVPTVVQAEEEARQGLISENRKEIESEIRFALKQLLKLDWDDNSEKVRCEITRLMSRVRMGIRMGLLGSEDADRVREMLELVQLRYYLDLAVSVEDYRAASRLRDRINVLEKGSP